MGRHKKIPVVPEANDGPGPPGDYVVGGGVGSVETVTGLEAEKKTATVETVKALREEYKQTKGAEEKPDRKPRKRRVKREELDEAEQANMQRKVASFSSFTIMFANVLVVRMPNPKPLDEDEKQMLSEAVAAVIEKYYPDIQQWAPEAMLAFAVVLVFGGRLVKSKVDEAEKELSQQTGERNETASSSASAG